MPSHSKSTVQRLSAPTAMLVGLEGTILQTCRDILTGAGLKVLAVGHVAAGCERIPVVMPQLVVARGLLPVVEAEMLHDSCVAVGAELLRVAAEVDPASFERTLKSAAGVARIKALGLD